MLDGIPEIKHVVINETNSTMWLKIQRGPNWGPIQHKITTAFPGYMDIRLNGCTATTWHVIQKHQPALGSETVKGRLDWVKMLCENIVAKTNIV